MSLRLPLSVGHKNHGSDEKPSRAGRQLQEPVYENLEIQHLLRYLEMPIKRSHMTPVLT